MILQTIMKQNILLFIFLSLLGTKVSAHDIEVKNNDGVTIFYNYSDDGKELQVTYCGDYLDHYLNEYRGTVVIPEEVTYMGRTRKVTSIGNSAFQECSELTSVSIGNNVTSIGNSAFLGCRGLTSVSIGNNVTSIGYAAFYRCSSLTDLSIPNNVTIIGENAFYECSSLTDLSIPNNVTIIGEGAFSNCYGLTSVKIGNNVTSIGWLAFGGCSNLTSLTIGNSVTSIGNYAFTGAKQLTEIISLIEEPFEIAGKRANEAPFPLDVFMNAAVYVPAGTIDKYKATAGWQDFVFIEEGTGNSTQESQQCETPTILYQDGKLTFSCETEGATCHYSITDSDIKTGNDNEVVLSVTYHISVYATKPGLKESETTTATLCWIDSNPQMEGVINDVTELKSRALLIKNEGGNLTIEGAEDGEPVNVYTTNGIQAGAAVCKNGKVMVKTNIQGGKIAIVKIGKKNVKVLMK